MAAETVSLHQFRDVSILTLTYAWPNGKILRFALYELATPAAQSVLRICNGLYGQATILESEVADQSEVRDAATFLAILGARRRA